MKKTLVWGAALAGIAIFGWAQATHEHEHGSSDSSGKTSMMAGSMMPGSMMNGSMMGGPGDSSKMAGMMESAMMNDPLHRSAMTLFALPEMKSELGLSDKQAGDLKKLREDAISRAKDLSAKSATEQKELSELLSNETSRTGTVRSLLNDIAELRAQKEFLGFETAAKMKAELTADQRTKLAGMKPGELHQIVMSRVPMAERMEMMQFLSGEGMMREGMMRGMMTEMHTMPMHTMPMKEAAPAEKK